MCNYIIIRVEHWAKKHVYSSSLFILFNGGIRGRKVVGRNSAQIPSWPWAKLWQDMTPHFLPFTQWMGEKKLIFMSIISCSCHCLCESPTVCLPLISGVKVKSRCVVRAKLIMVAGHRLIPIALLSAPATPVFPASKGFTDRWDGALWDRVLIWHKKKPPNRSFLGTGVLHKWFTLWIIAACIRQVLTYFELHLVCEFILS